LAAVTDLEGRITGVQRTWLDPLGGGKARIPAPRRALGHLLGNGVRFGAATNVLVAGEGIETVLSLKTVMPTFPMVAALSTSHLAPCFARNLQRLTWPGRRRAGCVHWSAWPIERESRLSTCDRQPCPADFNDDLRVPALFEALRVQTLPMIAPALSDLRVCTNDRIPAVNRHSLVRSQA
jgi:hypothetical protein